MDLCFFPSGACLVARLELPALRSGSPDSVTCIGSPRWQTNPYPMSRRPMNPLQSAPSNQHCVTSPSRSGVFATSTDRRVDTFTESVSFDQRLYAHDIAGSIAHAQMLADVGLIPHDECGQLVAALETIRAGDRRGQLPLRVELEDIHMHIEQALIDRLGDVGRKLHTGAAATTR